MKVYKKCKDSYIEIEIPLEQCVEALRELVRVIHEGDVDEGCTNIALKAIRDAEEFLKSEYLRTTSEITKERCIMKTVCHYEGSEFVPCYEAKVIIKLIVKTYNHFTGKTSLSFESALNAFIDINDVCPHCSETLKPPETLGQIMIKACEEDNRPWWFVPKIIVRDDNNNLFTILQQGDDLILKSNSFICDIKKIKINEIKPISGPFDMIPEWATHIEFNRDNQSYFQNYIGNLVHGKKRRAESFHTWHNCPEEFKGKTLSLEDLK